MSKQKRPTLSEISARLDLLTQKLQLYESGETPCGKCNLASDGFRLAQEVELLRKENAQLRKLIENLEQSSGAIPKTA